MAGSIKRYSSQEVIAALKLTKGMKTLAAKHLGCDPRTVYNYCERFPTVEAACKHQRRELVETAELQLWQAVQRGMPWAIQLVLRTLGREDGFSERTEVTGANGGPIEHAHIHLWEERLQAVHDEMAAKKAAIQLERTAEGRYDRPVDTA